MPTIAIVDFEKHSLNVNAIGGYHSESGTLYINSKYDTPQKIPDFRNKVRGRFANTTEYAPYLHELGHKYYEDCINAIVKSQEIKYDEAKKMIDLKIYNYVEQKSAKRQSLKDLLSVYAMNGYNHQKYTEVIAECFSVGNNNIIAQELLRLIGGA